MPLQSDEAGWKVSPGLFACGARVLDQPYLPYRSRPRDRRGPDRIPPRLLDRPSDRHRVATRLHRRPGEDVRDRDQAGAILAVCWEFRAKLAHGVARASSPTGAAQRFAANLVIAFLPAARARPCVRQARSRRTCSRRFRSRARSSSARSSSSGPSGGKSAAGNRAHRIDRRHALDRRAEGRLRAGARARSRARRDPERRSSAACCSACRASPRPSSRSSSRSRRSSRRRSTRCGRTRR